MRAVNIILAVLFSSICSMGQNACTLPSCRSFHELLNTKDADILEKIGKGNEAFVCFRADQDSFFIAEYSRITWSSWIRDSEGWPNDATSGPFYAYGSASMTNYRRGQDDDWYAAGPLGKWKAWGHMGKYAPKNGAPLITDGPPPMFSEKCSFPDGEKCSFFIDNTGFKFFRNFTNKNEGTTDYSLEIRLSTGRYTETYSWSKAKDLDAGEDTNTGRCEVYSEGKKVR